MTLWASPMALLVRPLMSDVSARVSGAKVHLDLEGNSLKSKMRRAAKWNADWGVISGPEERSKGVVVFRNMKESSQEEIPADELLSRLLSKFPTKTFLL